MVGAGDGSVEGGVSSWGWGGPGGGCQGGEEEKREERARHGEGPGLDLSLLGCHFALKPWLSPMSPEVQRLYLIRTWLLIAILIADQRVASPLFLYSSVQFNTVSDPGAHCSKNNNIFSKLS